MPQPQHGPLPRINAPGLPATLTQAYSYDGVTRLGGVTETGGGTNWSRTYAYGAYGNLQVFKIASFEWTASYDADNKQTAFCPGTESACSGIAAGSKTVYDYDGGGRRVRKIVNDDEASLYVYDAFGNLAAEYADFAPAGPTGTQYRTTDHLGSTRVVSDAGGAILSRRDFFPVPFFRADGL